MKIVKVCLCLTVLELLLMLPPWGAGSAAAAYLYINTSSISLHSLPLFSSPVSGTGQLNDRVQKLGDSPRGWIKVRILRDGSQGWLPTRYVSGQMVTFPRPAAANYRKRVKRSSPPKKTPQPEEKAPEPERPQPM